jgi:hypothetical protein
LQVLEAVTKLKGRHRLAEDAILRLNSSLLEITQVCQNCQIQCSYQVSGLQTQVKLPSPSDVSTSYQKNGHHEWQFISYSREMLESYLCMLPVAG